MISNYVPFPRPSAKRKNCPRLNIPELNYSLSNYDILAAVLITTSLFLMLAPVAVDDMGSALRGRQLPLQQHAFLLVPQLGCGADTFQTLIQAAQTQARPVGSHRVTAAEARTLQAPGATRLLDGKRGGGKRSVRKKERES